MSSSFLLLLATALAGVISWELTVDHDAGSPEPEIARPAPQPPSLPKLRVGNEVAEQARTALARPLFQPDRRPGTTVPSPLPVAEALPRLTALLSGPFGRRAIFAGADGRSMAVEEGAALGSWTVVSIGAWGVSVTGRDGERTVRLRAGTREPAPAPVTEAVDEHESGALTRVPTAGPMFRYPGDPPAGRR